MCLSHGVGQRHAFREQQGSQASNPFLASQSCDKRYAWTTRWNENATIVEAKAYLDSLLVSDALKQNEYGSPFTYSDPRKLVVRFDRVPNEGKRDLRVVFKEPPSSCVN